MSTFQIIHKRDRSQVCDGELTIDFENEVKVTWCCGNIYFFKREEVDRIATALSAPTPGMWWLPVTISDGDTELLVQLDNDDVLHIAQDIADIGNNDTSALSWSSFCAAYNDAVHEHSLLNAT